MPQIDRALIAAFVYLFETGLGQRRAMWTPAVVAHLTNLRNACALSRAEATIVIQDSSLGSPFAAAFVILFEGCLGPFRTHPESDFTLTDLHLMAALRKQARMSFQRANMLVTTPEDPPESAH